MASAAAALSLAAYFFLVAVVLARLDCEDLAVEDCAFAVSGTGARCLLEKRMTENRAVVYECQTSPVVSERAEAWIETDECLASCGLQRMSVGISSDGLLQREFVEKWCSPSCQNNCPNLVELFNKLAAGEDIQLTHVCNFLARPTSRRLIGEAAGGHVSKATLAAINSMDAAMAPMSGVNAENFVSEPAPAPWSL